MVEHNVNAKNLNLHPEPFRPLLALRGRIVRHVEEVRDKPRTANASSSNMIRTLN